MTVGDRGRIAAAPSIMPTPISLSAHCLIIALCAALAGCSEEEALDDCRRQVEPTVLLRQLALPPKKKADAEFCLANIPARVLSGRVSERG